MHAVTFESVEGVSPEDFALFVTERPDDLYRCELLNGRIVMSPPTGWPGAEVELGVGVVLTNHVWSLGAGRVFGATQGFALPTGDVVAPDAAFVSTARWDAAGPPGPGPFLTVVPDLVVEVLSRSTASRDRGEKKAIYARSGVREYWLLDLHDRSVTQFVLQGSTYDQGTRLDLTETITSTVLPDLTLPVAQLTRALD